MRNWIQVEEVESGNRAQSCKRPRLEPRDGLHVWADQKHGFIAVTFPDDGEQFGRIEGESSEFELFCSVFGQKGQITVLHMLGKRPITKFKFSFPQKHLELGWLSSSGLFWVQNKLALLLHDTLIRNMSASVPATQTSIYMLPLLASLPASPLGVVEKTLSTSYCDLHSRSPSLHAADRQWRLEIGKRTTADSQRAPERPKQ